jgi:excisionase family DNA binding protein
MIKKVFSPRHNRDVWMFEARVDGRRLRQSGFGTKSAAELALASVVSRSLLERGEMVKSRMLSEIVRDEIVDDAVAEAIEEYVLPLKEEIKSLKREQQEQRRMVEGLRATVERRQAVAEGLRHAAAGMQLIRLWEAAKLVNLHESQLRAAIKEGALSATKVGGAFKLRRVDVIEYAGQVFKEGTAAAQEKRLAQLKDSLKAARERILKAKQMAREAGLGADGEWRVKVRAAFPELIEPVIEMLPDAKPSAIALEQVGDTELGVSGRQLQRILAENSKNGAIKTDDKNGRH